MQHKHTSTIRLSLNGDKMISMIHIGIYMVNMHGRQSVGGLHCLVQSLHQMKPP